MDSYCDRQDCLEQAIKTQTLKGHGYIRTCAKHSPFPEDFLLPGVFFIHVSDWMESD